MNENLVVALIGGGATIVAALIGLIAVLLTGRQPPARVGGVRVPAPAPAPRPDDQADPADQAGPAGKVEPAGKPDARGTDADPATAGVSTEDVTRSRSRRGRTVTIVAFATAVVVAVAATIVLSLSVAGEPTPCTDPVPLAVTSSTEKNNLIDKLAERYNTAGRRFGDRCARVTVSGVSSGTAMEALAAGWRQHRPKTDDERVAPEPQVWMPTDALWLELLRARPQSAVSLPTGPARPVAQSPLVIALPRSAALALGWPDQSFGWQDVLRFAQRPAEWDRYRQPGWGAFAIGKDYPKASTSGMAATIATYYAAVSAVHQRTGKLTRGDINDPEVVRYVRDVEAGTHYLRDDIMNVLRDLGERDLRGEALAYLSGMVLQQQLVHLYNSGDPEVFGQDTGAGRREPLHTFYPSDGTLMLNHPYVVLPGISADQRDAAEDFLEFLREPGQQASFIDQGFLGYEGGDLSEEMKSSMRVPPDSKLTVLPTPDVSVLAEIHAGVDTLRRKARVLLVLDMSGSMNEPVPGTPERSVTGLTLVREALGVTLDQLNERDQVGIWAFDGRVRHVWWPPVEVRAVTPAQRQQIQDLRADGPTALYQSVRTAVDTMAGIRAKDRPADADDWVTAVVVLSDGKDTASQVTLPGIIDHLRRQEHRVPVITIAYGSDADPNSLRAISDATGERLHYDAKQKVSIEAVFLDVFRRL